MSSSREQVTSGRRFLEPALIVLLALAAILIYLNSPALVEVSHAELIADDRVRATVNTCGYELSVAVDEIDSLVAIEVFDHHFRMDFGHQDCRRTVDVPLSVSLGGRVLIDGATGQRLLGP